MIKNEYIQVIICPKNKKYYSSKGYNDLNYGDIAMIYFYHLPSRAKQEIEVICDYCGKEYTMPYCNYHTFILNGKVQKCSCVKCRGKKIKESNLKTYGISNVMNLEDSKNKLYKTMIDRYGVKYSLLIPEAQIKRKNSLVQKFGTENINTLPEMQEKRKNSNLIKYGVEFYQTTEECKEKVRITCQDKYGVDNAFQNINVREKQLHTINTKYNCNNVFQNEDIKNKIKETMIAKYNVPHPMQNEDIKNRSIINGLKSKYKYGTATCSSQQKYLHNLLGGELNFPVGRSSLDIAFPNEKIYIEYNGSGHDLDVKIGRITEEQFKIKSIRRYCFLKSLGWKMIEINSKKDLLPENTTILEEIKIAKEYLHHNTESHYIINITETKYLNLRKINNTSTINDY